MAGNLSAAGHSPLPPLRRDLRFERQAASGGASAWRLHDPLQHRFFGISEDTRNILSLWGAGTSFEELAASARQRFGLELSSDRFGQLVEFLSAANLLAPSQDTAWRDIAKKREKAAEMNPGKLFSSLMFFKIPLFNPEPLLRALAPLTEPVFSRGFAVLMGLVLLAGLYLSFFDLVAAIGVSMQRISLAGIAGIAFTVLILKAAHELGHAVTARRYGCRVPVMGIGFMLCMPLPYTDVTEAWRLASKRQRIAIGAAGMLAEMGLAAVATLMWAFIPDGSVRDLAFHVATVGWISSIAFNLNPFAKFDGYYILADLLGIENLQSRSLALARWRMRKALLFPRLPAPDTFPPAQVNWLVSFAAVTWLHRMAVLGGLAALVYFTVAKALALILVAAGVVLLVAVPLFREIAAMRQMAAVAPAEARPNRVLVLAAAGFLLLFVPLWGAVRVPAVLSAGDLQMAFPPRDARIAEIAVKEGDRVKTGDLIVRFQAPELDASIREAEIQLTNARQALQRAVSDLAGRSNLTMLRNDAAALERRLGELEAERALLSVHSRIDGEVAQLSREARPGAWISHSRWVALVRSGDAAVARGYLSEGDLSRVERGNRARFVPEDPARASLALEVVRISPDAARSLELAELADANGGPVATSPSGAGRHEPAHAIFPVELAAVGSSAAPQQSVRGTVVIQGRRQSLAGAVWRSVARVLVRESSF